MSPAVSLSFDWRRRAARWLTRPRPAARPAPFVARRVFLCEADVVTLLASGSGPPDPRKVELDIFGQRIVSAWGKAGRPAPLEPKKTYQRPSRARQRGESPADERVTRPLSKDEERAALEILASRFVRPEPGAPREAPKRSAFPVGM